MAKAPVVARDECIGCGTCAEIAAKTFKMDDEEKAVVVNPGGDQEATIQDAIDSCTNAAISWEG